MTRASELLNTIGGRWISAARSWIQRRKRNGSDLDWSSGEPLLPYVTMREAQEIAAEAVAADRDERDGEANRLLAKAASALELFGESDASSRLLASRIRVHLERLS